MTDRGSLGGGDEVARALLDALAAHAAVLDMDGTVVAVNHGWTTFRSEHPGDPWRPAVGDSFLRACEQAAHLGWEQAPAIADAVRSVLAGSQPRHAVAYRHSVRGEDLWFNLRVAALDVPGLGALVTHTDITGRKRVEMQLEHQALHDPLTGLPNRTLFLDRLSLALARMERSPTTVAVLFIDLDRFKVVNDSLGHDAGDRLLAAVAGRLRAAVRPGDTAARFGGDEFTVLCEGMTSEHDAVLVAERISDAVLRPFTLEEGEACLSSSIGIAMASSHDDVPEALIRDADAAMYRAKQRTESRYELFSGVIRQRAIESLEIKNALHRAFEREEFRLYFQPEVDLATGRVTGMEALLRWEHPEMGLLAAREWLSMAEEIALMAPLGAWVVARACQQAARWHQDPAHERLRVTVNLCGRELGHPGVVETVLKAAAQHSVDPTTLGVEVGQASMSADLHPSASTLARLREAGVTITVDDFGAGAAPLTDGADAVKVDCGSVLASEDQERSGAVLRALVGLGHALGVRVVGKRVETAEQLAQLRSLGCDAAQGFHLGAPQPPEDLVLRS